MADVYVCGHGGWRTIGMGTVFVDLPPFTEVVLYKEVGHEMDLTEAEDLLSQNGHGPAPARIISGWEHCPDMSLFSAAEFGNQFYAAAQQGGVRALVVDGETRLSEMMNELAGNRVHWIACSSRMLRAP